MVLGSLEMVMAYYAVRPAVDGDRWTEESSLRVCRIERASTPEEAARLSFGRGTSGLEYKLLGTRISVVRSDKQRVALLRSPDGWTRF